MLEDSASRTVYSYTWFLVLYHVKPQCLIWTWCSVIGLETERWLRILWNWYGTFWCRESSLTSEAVRNWVWCSGSAGTVLYTTVLRSSGESLNTNGPAREKKRKGMKVGDVEAGHTLHRKCVCWRKQKRLTRVRWPLWSFTLKCNCAVGTASNWPQ